MSAIQSPYSGLLAKRATTFTATGLTGFPLVNGTPTILSWTAPNDGQFHRVVLVIDQSVTVTEVGGQLAYSFFCPDGSGPGLLPFAGSFGAGFDSIIQSALVGPGTTFTFSQNTALTSGTATVWAEIWAS